MLVQQAIDQAQQLHHALLRTAAAAVPVLPSLYYEVARPSVCAHESQPPVAAAVAPHHLHRGGLGSSLAILRV